MTAGTLTVNTATEFDVGGTVPVASVAVAATGNAATTFPAPTVTDGDVFVNNGETYLIVKNKTDVNVAMTITAPGKDEYGETADVVITAITGATTPYKWWVFGPFSTKHFNATYGAVLDAVKVTFDTNHANLEVAVFKYGPVYE